MEKNEENKIFMKITNKDVYNKLINLGEKLDEFIVINSKDHTEIIKRQDITNGKVKLNRWVATTAISLGILALGFLFSYITL